MELQAGEPTHYLGEDDVVDVSHPLVAAVFDRVAAGAEAEVGAGTGTGAVSDEDLARAAFEHVRDAFAHTVDAADPRVTVSASDVAREGVGLCYAKSHLLVALLRRGGIPAGICYQRLADGDGHVVHGLTAVRLRGVWHRLDPRGNKPGVDAQFSLDGERLAWAVDPAAGEVDYPTVFTRPHPAVVEALRGADDALALVAGGLPTRL